MTKQEFLEALQAGLANVPPDERAAALQYYTEYLDDAGGEHEAEALEELGSPERIIAEIRTDSERDGWVPPTHEARALPSADAPPPQTGGERVDRAAVMNAPAVAEPPSADVMWGGSYPVIPPPSAGAGEGPPLPPEYLASRQPLEGEEPPAQQPEVWQQPSGGEPPPPSMPLPPPPPGAEWAAAPEGVNAQGQQTGQTPPPVAQPQMAPQPKPWTAGRIVLLVLAILFLWPFILVFIAVLFVLLIALVIILAVPIIVGVSMVAASLAALVFGGLMTAVVPPSGLVFIGGALLVLGLGLLCTWGGAALLGAAVPGLFRGLFALVKRIFHRA